MSNTPATTLQQPEEPTPTPAIEPIDEQARKSAMFTVFLVVFIDLLGFGIVLPLLPLYARDLLVPIVPHHLQGVSLGLLMSSFSAMQFLFAPIWGRISDRIGRRPILLLGLAGSVGLLPTPSSALPRIWGRMAGRPWGWS